MYSLLTTAEILIHFNELVPFNVTWKDIFRDIFTGGNNDTISVLTALHVISW